MAKEATLQVKMDADLKEQAEELYKKQETGKRIGIVEGEFTVPEDIDKYNDEIADMFGGI